MFEVARRYRLAMLRLLDVVESAEKVDWEKLAAARNPLPPEIERLVFTLRVAGSFDELYDPEHFVHYNHSALPGAHLSPNVFLALGERAGQLRHNNPAYKQVEQTVFKRAGGDDALHEKFESVLGARAIMGPTMGKGGEILSATPSKTSSPPKKKNSPKKAFKPLPNMMG